MSWRLYAQHTLFSVRSGTRTKTTGRYHLRTAARYYSRSQSSLQSTKIACAMGLCGASAHEPHQHRELCRSR